MSEHFPDKLDTGWRGQFLLQTAWLNLPSSLTGKQAPACFFKAGAEALEVAAGA